MWIATKPSYAYPWYLRPFFWNQHRKYGAVLDTALLWARTPKVFLGVALLYGMIDRRRSPLDPALRSLVTVRVSQLNGCRFCVDLNSATLLKRGVALDKIMALDGWMTSGLFTPRERVALEYAEAVTLRCAQIDNAVIAAVKCHFDDDCAVELTALIAFQNMSSKFNSALGVPSQGFVRYLQRRRNNRAPSDRYRTYPCIIGETGRKNFALAHTNANVAKRLKTLRGLTPHEFTCKAWTENSENFRISPLHHTLGPYT